MNNFIWTDLSTYHVDKALDFYSKVFGWEYQSEQGYHLAYNGNAIAAGIYETPAFFQKIKMPHFWMNYIQVEDLKAKVNLARTLGAKVELEDVEFYKGKIALIRDPMGAGFTIYEGEGFDQNQSKSHGTVIGRELHVSDATVVIGFYETFLDWTIVEKNPGEYMVTSQNGEPIARILELTNEIKGKYEYWVTIIKVENPLQSRKSILDQGGHIIQDEGQRILCTDTFGEAFFYIQA